MLQPVPDACHPDVGSLPVRRSKRPGTTSIMTRPSGPPADRIPATTLEWRNLGRAGDVLYNVCTWEPKRGTWTEEEFYASGLSDWADLSRHWLHYEPSLGGTCLEIGCGPGRVTRALAGSFSKVVGIDVSEDLLARARAVVPDNVELHQVDSVSIPLGDATIDAVFSIHVFLHLENLDTIRRYLADAFRVLRPGGTAMVHFWMAGTPAKLRNRIAYFLRLILSRRGIRRGRDATSVRVTTVKLEDMYATVQGIGYEDIEFRFILTRYTGYMACFCFARKPAATN
jgi:SAM-dependent methyltransferase